MDTKQLDRQYITGSYGRVDLEIASAKGSFVYDEKGNEYIDFGTGIAVNIFGGCDEKWQQAVTEQLNKVQHASNYFYTRPQS